MQNPFKRLVGLKGVDADNSATSWVNELPGLSTELVDALTRSDEEQAADVWARIHAAAYDRLDSEIMACLSGDSTYQSVINRLWEPILAEGTALEAEDHYVGLRLTVFPMRKSRLQFATVVFLADIQEQQESSIVIVHKGQIVYEQQVTVQPGVNEIPVAFTFYVSMFLSNVLFVGVDAENIPLLPIGKPMWGHSNGADYNAEPAYCFGGIVSHGLTDPNYYLYAEVEHSHSMVSIIPQFAEQLRLAYLYLCGSLLMTEKLASTNFNLFTNTNRDFTIEQEEKLMKDFKAAVKPVARLIKQSLEQQGSLKPATDTDSGYSMGSFV